VLDATASCHVQQLLVVRLEDLQQHRTPCASRSRDGHGVLPVSLQIAHPRLSDSRVGHVGFAEHEEQSLAPVQESLFQGGIAGRGGRPSIQEQQHQVDQDGVGFNPAQGSPHVAREPSERHLSASVPSPAPAR
jgi:hypothetical protein